jgi:hypothetical protein
VPRQAAPPSPLGARHEAGAEGVALDVAAEGQEVLVAMGRERLESRSAPGPLCLPAPFACATPYACDTLPLPLTPFPGLTAISGPRHHLPSGRSRGSGKRWDP